MMSIDAGLMERHANSATACQVCGGHDRMPRGRGERCHGYTAERTVYCTQIPSGRWSDGADGYLHRRFGECDCGETHNPFPDHFTMIPNSARGRRQNRPSEARNQRWLASDAEAVYLYEDASGTPLYRVLRFSDPKTFRQQRLTADGRWEWGLKGISPTLFNLPSVRLVCDAKGEIWVVEGEKDTNAMNEVMADKIVPCWATTNSGGATQWKREYAQLLKGASTVNILPDNDEAGEVWCQAVHESIVAELGRTKTKIWELPPGAEEGADWCDHAAAGGTLESLVLAFPTPGAVQRLAIRAPQTPPSELLRRDLEEPQTAALCWPSEIPHGPDFQGLTILSGQSGSSKSIVAVASSIAAALLGMEVFYITPELDGAAMQDRLQRYLCGSPIPPSWGYYMPQQYEPWENILTALEARCAGQPLVVFFDSINTIAANEESPTEHDVYQLGLVSEHIMWARSAVNRSEGLLGVCMISEANKAGEMKGRFTFRANLALDLEKDPKDYKLIDITVNKNFSGPSGPLGRYELDIKVARLAYLPDAEQEVEL